MTTQYAPSEDGRQLGGPPLAAGLLQGKLNLTRVTPRMITDLFGSVSVARETNRKRKKINKQRGSAAGQTLQKYLKREAGSLLPRALMHSKVNK